MMIKSEQRGASASQSRLLLFNKTSDIVEGKVKHAKKTSHRTSQGRIFPKTSSVAGFTLLEVLISMVILSIALLGLAALATTTIRSNTFSNDYSTATSLAQDQLETLVNTSFANLIPIGITQNDPSNPIDEQGNGGGKYTRTWLMNDITVGSTKSIAVTVSWTSSYGNAKNVVMNSIKSNT